MKLKFYDKSFEVSIDGKFVETTPLGFRILKVLSRYRGKVLSPYELLKHAWGFRSTDAAIMADSNTVTQNIYKLRRSMDRAKRGSGRRIVVIRGHGYKLRRP